MQLSLCHPFLHALTFWEVSEDFIDYLAAWKEYDPGCQEDEHEVGAKTDMILIPHLKRAFVGRNNLGIGLINVHALLHTFGKQCLFVSEDNRSNAGETWLNVVYVCLHLVGVWRECLVYQRTRPDNGHISEEDVEELRQFVDLRFAQETSERQNARVAMRRVKSASHVGTVEEHGRKLQNLEVLISIANAVLSVEDVMLARAFENYHHRHQQWRQDYDSNTRKDDVE